MKDDAYVMPDALRNLDLPPASELLGRTILCQFRDFHGNKTEVLATVISCSVPERSNLLRLVISYPTFAGYPVDGIYIDQDAVRSGTRLPIKFMAGSFSCSGTIEFL